MWTVECPLGKVADAGLDLAYDGFLTDSRLDPGADGVAIRFSAHKAERDGVALIASVVSQQ